MMFLLDGVVNDAIFQRMEEPKKTSYKIVGVLKTKIHEVHRGCGVVEVEDFDSPYQRLPAKGERWTRREDGDVVIEREVKPKR